MPMQMPKVNSCDVTECAYNIDDNCHALAINVEEGSPCAVCHTFVQFPRKAGAKDMIGLVGACKMDQCKFNSDLECTASGGIDVEKHGSHADCRTFST